MAYKTIMLKGAEFCPQDEAKAHEALYPGHFVYWDGDLEFAKIAESGVAQAKLIAIEDNMQGKKISDAYSAGDIVRARWCQPGTEVNAWLAKGHSVTQGDLLEFAGYEETGCLGKAEFHSASKGAGVVAVAKETVNNSAGSSAVRIKVQIV